MQQLGGGLYEQPRINILEWRIEWTLDYQGSDVWQYLHVYSYRLHIPA